MLNQLGFSVYLSNFRQMEPMLKSLYVEGSSIFTSFHISEEMDDTYAERVQEMCLCLNKIGYMIIADVSKKTIVQFGYTSLTELAFGLGIDVLRIDYGLSEEEIIAIGKEIPICVNASTIEEESVRRIVASVKQVYAMHNFYPRPETGLDREFFVEMNRILEDIGIKVISFVPGDEILRGPLFQSLPTLEDHRNCSPYAAWLDLYLTYNIYDIFVGDGVISQYEIDRIRTYQKESIMEIPVLFQGKYKELYGKIFTIRPDSPRWTKRLTESREYSCFGTDIIPEHCVTRVKGSITIDNSGYKRYSGEIQIITEDLPADDKVNVIGSISDYYHLLLQNIKNNQKTRFIEPNNHK